MSPRGVGRQVQHGAPRRAGEAPGCGEQSQAQPFGFPASGGVFGQGEQLVPSVEPAGERHDEAPDAVHQMRFWFSSCSGRLARPVSFAHRMRSSARAPATVPQFEEQPLAKFAAMKHIAAAPPARLKRSRSPSTGTRSTSAPSYVATVRQNWASPWRRTRAAWRIAMAIDRPATA
jgi:hypothetical protein